MVHVLRRIVCLVGMAVVLCSAVTAFADVPPAYLEHCAGCHGKGREGGSGPPLDHRSLRRYTDDDLLQILRGGREATQMPGFATTLSDAELRRIVGWLRVAPDRERSWTAADIVASHLVADVAGDVTSPCQDPWNVFAVVEAGVQRIVTIDGDRLEVVRRMPSAPAVHGGIKFSPDGRFAYVASRVGWVEKYDLWRGVRVARIRVARATRNIAVASDGNTVVAANLVPPTLVFLDGRDLRLQQVLDVRAENGRASRVSAVYDLPHTRRFLALLKDAPELWLIDEPRGRRWAMIRDGGSEELARSIPLSPLRRIVLPRPFHDVLIVPDETKIYGATRGASGLLAVRLDDGRVVQELPLSGLPHLAAGAFFRRDGRLLAAAPDLQRPVMHIFDPASGTLVTDVAMPGKGFFVRAHEHAPDLWADVFWGEHRDQMVVVDRNSLTIRKILVPEPGRTSSHVEFDRHGRFALVSIWEDDGAIVVYDTRTLREVKRIPLRKPVGKYNAWNKVHGSIGTSH